jgi:hypothetical protein
MDYLHLLYQLPAVFTGSVMVSRLLPFKLDKRYGPLLTFLVALCVLLLPVLPDMALALIWPVDLLHRFHKTTVTGHEPVKVPGVAQVRKRLKPPRCDITKYATRAYLRMGEEPAPAGPPEDDEDAPGEVPVVKSDDPPAIRSYIPAL